jgi:Rne/Rng family ribonuclease
LGKTVEILIEEMDDSLWAAALDSGRLVGLEVDPSLEEVRWGSVYWARVFRIDAALDAAFVDLDGENKGILNCADVYIQNENGTITRGGNIAIGKLLRPGQMIAVQAKSGYLPKDDNDGNLHSEDKIPTVSMNIALNGRYLIYTPMAPENRVSQRIRDKKLREGLMKMLESLDDVRGMILRAAAAHTQTDILIRESRILKSVWEQLKPHFTGDESGLIMEGPDALQRMLADFSGTRIERIEVVTMDHYQQVEEWCEIFAPDLMTKITPVEVDDPESGLALFEHRDLMGQIEDLFQPYALLPSGGSIIIEETAALTAIDVNSGADKRGRLATNLEAAEEIARQVRVRNLGGMIVIDFLKMRSKDDQNALLSAFENFITDDPCTVHVHGISKMGLVEITRARRTPALSDRFETIFEDE